MASMSRRWRGQWIWATTTGHAPSTDPLISRLDPDYFDRRVLFRRTFSIDEMPATAPFRITGDSRYILTVNGVELSRGPIRHGYRQLFYDRGDAVAALRLGDNVIAIRARFFGQPNAWWVPAPTTRQLGGGAVVAELDTGTELIRTDDSWRCLESDAWTPSRPASALSPQIPELLDARLLDPDWDTVGYDDSGWSPATVLADSGFGMTGDGRPPSEPYGALRPSPLPPQERTVHQAVSVSLVPLPAQTPATDDIAADLAARLGAEAADIDPSDFEVSTPTLLIADFGKVVSGLPQLRFSANGPVVVRGALTELPEPKQMRHVATFAYTAREGANTYTREDPCGGRYLVLEVTGGTATFDAIEQVESMRPRPSGPYFEASDPDLARIYRLGVRTVDLNAQDAYLDCPSREQRAWTGDSVVHQSVDLVANPDWSLAQWNPELLAQPRADGMLPMVGVGDFSDPSAVAIPDWSLHWVRSVHNLYRYTGDREQVSRLLPIAERALRWFSDFLDTDGLLHDVTGWVLIDWSPVPVAGASASLNALWGRALHDFAEMASWLDDAGRAAWASGLLAQLAAGFDAFWDSTRGAYREHIINGEPQPTVTEHGNAAAVCAGIVPADRLPRIRELLLDRDAMFTRATFLQWSGEGEPTPDDASLVVGAQPFFRYVVHDALALLGAADEIAGLCREWLRLEAAGPTAWREVWEGGSYAHGWCSTPTRDLVVYTLGVMPAGPGYAAVRVAPRLGALEWARGRVPTPHGFVDVDVRRDTVNVSSPVPVEVVARDGVTQRHPAGEVVATI